MLEELYLENYVLFEQASLRFSRGFNIISGETGAGKSLLAGAIGLALGERAAAEVIRSGTDKAVISAVFSLPDNFDKRVLAETGIEPDGEGKLVFERVLRRDGPSRLSVNGRPATAAAARELSVHLLDIAAQNEYTRLVESSYQRELLDKYGKLEKPAEEFAIIFRQALSLHNRLQAGDAEKARVRRRLEEVRYELDLIAQADYVPEEDDKLEHRISALTHAEALQALATKGEGVLYENEGAVQDVLGSLLREAEDMAEYSPALKEVAENLAEAIDRVEEAVRGFREVGESVEAAGDELESLIERAEMLKKLARRLDCEISSLPEKEKALREEEENLSGWEADTASVKRELLSALARAAMAGAKLLEARKKTGKKLAKDVNAALADLGMEQAGFAVEFAPLWKQGDEPEALVTKANAGGLEEVRFLIAPNPGEAASTLAETASGGETSRTMLAIKSALSAAHCPPVLFFDEVDAGIGGRLGDNVGEKMKALSASRQVISITHLPQIAAKADTHLKVAKKVSKGRTLALVEELQGEARVEEIAQMIRGEAATATTRQQAREMLET
jgi:DNA repair protein RecN (Recombination protein N)